MGEGGGGTRESTQATSYLMRAESTIKIHIGSNKTLIP